MAFANPYYFSGEPGWQAGSDRRLGFAMVLAALIIAGVLNMFRMPVAGESIPLVELVVRLIQRVAESTAEPEAQAETRPVTESEPQPTPAPLTDADIVQPTDIDPASLPDTQPAEPTEIIPVPREAVATETELFPTIEIRIVDDWHEFGGQVVREFIANLPKPFTVNPVFDEKRRVAAIKFRPSKAPVKRGPWDDVEKDQIGRTILNLGGGCFRVLDDPSAVYRDIFETYTQFVVQCTIAFGRPKGKELPWVNEVRLRHAYLRLREQQRRDPDAF